MVLAPEIGIRNLSSTTKRRLKKARRTRHLIASEFALLETGRITITDVLGRPKTRLDRVSIYDVLRRVPKLGKEGSQRVLRNANVWPLKHLGELTDEERASVVRHLPPRAK